MKYEINEMYGIKGNVAVITGGARGIGREIATAMGCLGAKIALVDISEEHLDIAVKELIEQGIEAIGVKTDITKKKSVQEMAKTVAEKYGRIDILVNCAGVTHNQDAVNFDDKKWQFVMDVNVKGTMLTCQAVGKYMLEQKKGRIVNFSSVRGLQGKANYLAYAPSKGAVNMLTKTLATEWAKDNVNVNAVAPTFTLTDINKNILDNKETYDWVISRIPKGTLCETKFLVGPVIFLCSPCSEFITGDILYVDGGWTAS
jgi:NAD(P)-dependent dehydrogenase (short-subunit alcohol dehydrogenase family)